MHPPSIFCLASCRSSTVWFGWQVLLSSPSQLPEPSVWPVTSSSPAAPVVPALLEARPAAPPLPWYRSPSMGLVSVVKLSPSITILLTRPNQHHRRHLLYDAEWPGLPHRAVQEKSPASDPPIRRAAKHRRHEPARRWRSVHPLRQRRFFNR